MTEQPTERQDLRQTAFVTVVIAFLVFLYLFSPFTSVFLGWFVEFEDNISHKVHEVTFGLLFSIIFVGVLAQVRESTRSFAGAIQAAIAAVSLSVIVALTTGWEWPTLMYLAPLGAVLWLHPDRRHFFRFKLQPNLPALVMMLLIVAPLLDAMAREVDKAANEVRGHISHWAGMAAFAATLLIIGLLSALRVHRWQLMAWSTALSIAIYAILSLRFPFDASARPGVPAVLAIVWSGLFIFLSKVARPVPAVTREPAVICPNCATVNDPGIFTQCRVCAAPLDAAEPVAAPPPGTRPIWQTAAIGLGGLAVVVIGLAIAGAARSFSPPPVPHVLESRSPASCLECHATGDLHAPVIDWRTHPFTETPRFAPPACSECHDLPPITVTQQAFPGHPAYGSPVTQLVGPATIELAADARVRLVDVLEANARGRR